MWRLQFRNFGSHQSLLGNFVTDATGGDVGGVRWFELRNTGGGWGLHQEGTYSPDDDNRWMGSIAMDGLGNVALAYNVSNATNVFPLPEEDRAPQAAGPGERVSVLPDVSPAMRSV